MVSTDSIGPGESGGWPRRGHGTSTSQGPPLLGSIWPHYILTSLENPCNDDDKKLSNPIRITVDLNVHAGPQASCQSCTNWQWQCRYGFLFSTRCTGIPLPMVKLQQQDRAIYIYVSTPTMDLWSHPWEGTFDVSAPVVKHVLNSCAWHHWIPTSFWLLCKRHCCPSGIGQSICS